jgi:diguanylate cyclase (GGDEF)-like protein
MGRRFVVTGLVGLSDAVAGSLSVGLLVCAPDGSPVWANDALHRLVGDPAALLSAAARPTHPDERRELPWRTPDGAERWLEVECRRLRPDPLDGSADDGLLVLQVTDVSSRRELAEQAADRQRRLTRLEALAKTGSWEWRIATNEVDWSDELLRMFGYPPGTELNYAAYRAHVHPDDVGMVERTLAAALRTGEPFSFTHRLHAAGGDGSGGGRDGAQVLECHGEVIPDEAGAPARMLVTVHDVTEQRRVSDELAFLAERDPLTGLLNRRAVTARLRAQLTRAARGGALLLFDLDNFADLNDLRGHAVGDQVMQSLAELLADRVPADAVVGRLGGDEFAVILPTGYAADALASAEALCRVIATHAFAVGKPVAAGAADGPVLRLTVSVGIAPLAPAGDCDVLLANADLALSEAKEAGKNRARVFAPEQYQLAVRRVSALQRARDALDNGLMVVYAQPIVDLATRRVTSHELLVRLRDGLDPAIGPAEFLPAMERTDLVQRLDRWMVEQAVEALASRRARDDGLRLQVNMSTRSLEDPGFGDFVVATLRNGDVEPARLGLEITETAAITNLAAARRLAIRLTHAGCRFALDDFGAGFGSFTYLKHLPFTSVKIDGEFVRQADRAPGEAVFVQAVVTVARGLNMLTIAEYVDREQLVETLTRLGVDRAQGFHLGKPKPLSDLLAQPQAAS